MLTPTHAFTRTRIMRMRTLLNVVGGLAVAGLVMRRLRARFDWKDKVVVITGGARGLGLLLAREVARKGAHVAICARDLNEVQRAREELESYGGRVLAATCDVTYRDEVIRFISRVENELGQVDVLINNAGLIQVGPMEVMSVEDYDAAMKVHFWGPLYATLAVLPHMRAKHAGRIVNITSIAARVPVPHLLPYSASKFAAYGLSAGLRSELAKDGIVVTTICPGLMRTGSPRHAQVKGQRRAEYAWFKLSDSLPGASMSAKRAAKRIIGAATRGEADVVLSLPAKVLAALYGVAPSLVEAILARVTRLLPRPVGGDLEAVEGKDVESSAAPPFLTQLTDAAARENNEL
jgi:NAD(P)-dependent dehydrogenase (short-subunit alcohol dehydrogenase family)